MNFAKFYGFSWAEALVFDATRFGGHLYMFLLVFLDVSAIDLWARKVANFGPKKIIMVPEPHIFINLRLGDHDFLNSDFEGT